MGKVAGAKTCFEIRQEQARPILENLHVYLQEQHETALPKSPLGTAIGYALQ